MKPEYLMKCVRHKYNMFLEKGSGKNQMLRSNRLLPCAQKLTFSNLISKRVVITKITIPTATEN